MKKQLVSFAAFILWSVTAFAQADSTEGTFWNPIPAMHEAKQAVEVESLFPMFFYGGFHAGVGYRYDKFRVRISVINSGTYDGEPAGTKNSSPDYKRYYKTSPGFFLGYSVWRTLEIYGYLELHTFEITQKSTGLTRDIHSTDVGGGISYQFFFGRHLYLQPGFHIYFRGDHSADFNGVTYKIPNVDLAPVIRIGYRLWSTY